MSIAYPQAAKLRDLGIHIFLAFEVAAASVQAHCPRCRTNWYAWGCNSGVATPYAYNGTF